MTTLCINDVGVALMLWIPVHQNWVGNIKGWTFIAIYCHLNGESLTLYRLIITRWRGTGWNGPPATGLVTCCLTWYHQSSDSVLKKLTLFERRSLETSFDVYSTKSSGSKLVWSSSSSFRKWITSKGSEFELSSDWWWFQTTVWICRRSVCLVLSPFSL